jgi:hypothetical protein
VRETRTGSLEAHPDGADRTTGIVVYEGKDGLPRTGRIQEAIALKRMPRAHLLRGLNGRPCYRHSSRPRGMLSERSP